MIEMVYKLYKLIASVEFGNLYSRWKFARFDRLVAAVQLQLRRRVVGYLTGNPDLIGNGENHFSLCEELARPRDTQASLKLLAVRSYQCRD